MARVFKPYIVPHFAANLENRTLRATDLKTGKARELRLGGQLGAGWLGAVYRFALPDGSSGVIKFGHRPRFPAPEGPAARWVPSLSWKLKGESDQLTALMSALPTIRKSARFPLHTAWNPETLPVVPIIETIETREWGTLLTKPLVEGKPLARLAKEFGGRLPQRMRESAGEIFDLVQAINETSGLNVDIRPENFVWIEEKADLERFGYSRPGFILYEMDTVPFNLPQYRADNTPFQDFMREFETYLAAGAEVGRETAALLEDGESRLRRMQKWTELTPERRGQSAPPRAPLTASMRVMKRDGTMASFPFIAEVRALPLGPNGDYVYLVTDGEKGPLRIVDPESFQLQFEDLSSGQGPSTHPAPRLSDLDSLPDEAAWTDAGRLRRALCGNWAEIRARGDYAVIERVADRMIADKSISRSLAACMIAGTGNSVLSATYILSKTWENPHGLLLSYQQHYASNFFEGLALMGIVHHCGVIAYGRGARGAFLGVAVGSQVAGNFLFEENPVFGLHDPADFKAGLEAAALYLATAKVIESQGWWTWAMMCAGGAR